MPAIETFDNAWTRSRAFSLFRSLDTQDTSTATYTHVLNISTFASEDREQLERPEFAKNVPLARLGISIRIRWEIYSGCIPAMLAERFRSSY